MNCASSSAGRFEGDAKHTQRVARLGRGGPLHPFREPGPWPEITTVPPVVHHQPRVPGERRGRWGVDPPHTHTPHAQHPFGQQGQCTRTKSTFGCVYKSHAPPAAWNWATTIDPLLCALVPHDHILRTTHHSLGTTQHSLGTTHHSLGISRTAACAPQTSDRVHQRCVGRAAERGHELRIVFSRALRG